MEEVLVEKLDEVYIRIDSNEFFILKELVEYFTFKVPGAEFMPSYKNKMWDGKIRLYNIVTGEIYVGLFPYIEEYLKNNGIDQKSYSNNVKQNTNEINFARKE